MTGQEDHHEPEWAEDEELAAVLVFLGTAVAGLPDADTGTPIGASGVGANAAEAFRNSTFAIRDYCWCEGRFHPETSDWENDSYGYTEMPASGGTSSGCPMNFEHVGSGIRGTWYKHLGRDVRFSRGSEPGEALDILLDCLISIGYKRGHRWPAQS